ncbi:MAG TPA: YihY/virulence factor BrkB family protein [Xanthobacteraceae bacterium]
MENESSRGRAARTPSEIPARGWKDILLRIYQNISKHRVVLVAAGITFYSILALFPAIAALVALYGLFADPTTIAGNLDQLSGFVPEGATAVIRDQLNRLAAQGSSTLGLAFIVGLAVSLWSANAGVKSLFDGLNIVYDEEDERSFIKLNLVSLAFTLATLALALVALAAIIVVPVVVNFFGLAQVTNLIMRIARWPLLLVVVAFALAVLYRYGPDRARAQWRWISWGSAFAAVGWLAVSILFSWYAANFGSYNKTYGSLGAIMGFMFWIWLSAIVILIGAEIDAEMEHQTARDTTTGAPKPMGERGAKMADTLGAAQDGA